MRTAVGELQLLLFLVLILLWLVIIGNPVQNQITVAEDKSASPRNPQPETRNLQPESRNSQSETLHLQPKPQNPKP
jgi:hypothetical protein